MPEAIKPNPSQPENEYFKKYPSARIIGFLQSYNFAYKKDGKTFVDIQGFVEYIQRELEFELGIATGSDKTPFTRQAISFPEIVIKELEEARYIKQGAIAYKPTSEQEISDAITKITTALESAKLDYDRLPQEIIDEVNRDNPFWNS